MQDKNSGKCQLMMYSLRKIVFVRPLHVRSFAYLTQNVFEYKVFSFNGHGKRYGADDKKCDTNDQC